MSQPTIPEVSPGISPGAASPGGGFMPSLEGTAAVPPPAACPNCGAPAVGPYCAQCGQRLATRLLSVHHIVKDAVEDQLSLDASLPRTAVALLLHPGGLTREYVAGRIRSYIPPMRLYLSCSVLFFLALAFKAGPDRLVRDMPTGAAPVTATAGAAGNKDQTVNITVGSRRQTEGGVRVSGIQLDTLNGPRWLRDRMKAQAHHFQGMPPKQALEELLARLYNTAPKVAFVLLPAFALILKGLYFRRLYVEHFVFALHVHAAAFLAFTVMLLAEQRWVGLALMAWLAVYTFHALRVVYGNGWLRTFGKMTVLGGAYFLVLCAGIVGGTLAAILAG